MAMGCDAGGVVTDKGAAAPGVPLATATGVAGCGDAPPLLLLLWKPLAAARAARPPLTAGCLPVPALPGWLGEGFGAAAAAQAAAEAAAAAAWSKALDRGDVLRVGFAPAPGEGFGPPLPAASCGAL